MHPDLSSSRNFGGQFCSYIPGKDYRSLPYLTADFDYDLPDERIAQEPVTPRDSCKLLVLDRATGQTHHTLFTRIIDHLNPEDLLIVNDTRVLPARLMMRKANTHGAVEVLLLEQIEAIDPRTELWKCLVRPGKSARVGSALEFVESDDLDLAGCIRDVIDEGTRIIELQVEAGTVTEAIHSLGQVPLPPYITRTLDDAELYQTVYARDEHSAAAPTAGLHFTDDLLEQIEAKGIGLETVRLDVGIDTFRPVSADDPLDHRIHTEYIQVDGHTVEAIERVKACGGRVIAVGTTTARALETAYQAARKHAAESVPTLEPYAGRSGLFIVAGYEFGIVDALITNFHVPRSSLMMMVSALAGRDLIMETYRTALEGDYRFLSFGDAMLIQ